VSNPIQFTVYGSALPKGSMKAFLPKGQTRPIITSATKGLKDWEHKIASAAQAQATGILLTGPCRVSITFFLARPASLPKRKRFHTTRPDLDKLIRGATDALKDVLWKDDAQAVEILASKHYTETANEAPRTVFLITPISE
jgi:Holliday junction resolvase RusA-like endonuclease